MKRNLWILDTASECNWWTWVTRYLWICKCCNRLEICRLIRTATQSPVHLMLMPNNNNGRPRKIESSTLLIRSRCELLGASPVRCRNKLFSTFILRDLLTDYLHCSKGTCYRLLCCFWFRYKLGMYAHKHFRKHISLWFRQHVLPSAIN